MTTMRDVAKKAGLSVATISAVINNKPGVSAAARAKAQAAIDELHYIPNRTAQALSNNRGSTIAVLIPSIENPFFPQVVKSLEDVFQSNGYLTFVCNTEGRVDRAEAYIRQMSRGFIEGAVISLTWELTQPSILESFSKWRIPVVGLAGARPVEGMDAVIPDDPLGAFEAVEHLVKLGHRRIGFIAAQQSKTSEMRLQGYTQALETHGLALNDSYICLGRNYSNAEGYILTKSLLNRSTPPTAIFCFNDVMAQGALAAAHEEGIHVPDDLSIIGFDDTLGEYSYPQLSSVTLPKSEMGFLAGSLLMDHLNGRHHEPRLVKVKPRLVIRNSTAPPKTAFSQHNESRDAANLR